MSCTIPSGSYGFNLTVEGLSFVSSYASFNSYHVTTQNINHQVFRDCEFWTTNANDVHVAGLKMTGGVGDSSDNFYAYVQNCTFEGSSISLDNITDSWITHNVIFATNGANTGGRAFGIELAGSANDIKIHNNHIASAPDGAIYIHAKSTSLCISILGNFFDTAAPAYTSAPAIFVNTAQSGMVITGNCFSGVLGCAIDAVDLTYSTISGNSFYACGNTSGGGYSTILFSKSESGSGCIGNVVYGNVFNQPTALSPQVYAILENADSCTAHVYGMNSISGTGYLSQAIGFGSVSGDCLLIPSAGLNTKSGGTIVISASSTSVTASHNLAYTPSPEDFSLTNISGWGAANKVWISSVTSTQFSVNVDAAPGENITFGYRVEYRGNLSDA